MKTVPNEKRFSGCIVLVKGESFLSKMIIKHMILYAKQIKVPPLEYSHAEFLIWKESEKQLYTIGARGKGTEISKVQDYYGHTDIMILMPVKPIREIENMQLWNYFKYADPKKYQYSNFLSWIRYIKTFGFQWTAAVGSTRFYCYELAARFANHIGRWLKGFSLDCVSIYDLAYFNRENYKVYDQD